METIKKSINNFGKDSIIYLIGNIIVGINGLIAVSLYTHFFTSKDYGNYSLIIGTIDLIASILLGWVNQSIIRFTDYYDKKNKKNELFTTVTIITIIVNLIFFAIMFVVIYMFRKRLNFSIYNLYKISSIYFLAESIYNIIISTLRAYRKSNLVSIDNIVVSICKIGLVYLFVKCFKMNTESIIYSITIGYVIVSVISIKTMKINSHIKISCFSKDILSEFFKYGFPLLGISITSWILSISDRYAIKYFKNSSQVGIYTVNYNLASSIFNMLITFMMMSAFPIIVNTWNSKGKEKTECLINSMLRYYFIVTIPAIFAIMILSKPILNLISTPEYAEGYQVFYIVCIGIFLLGITQYTNKIWELTRKTSVIFELNGIAALANIILNILLIPKFGYKIAAITTVMSYLIYLIISLIKSYKLFRFNVNLKSIINIIISSTIMALSIKMLLFLVHNKIIAVILSIIIGFLMYLFMMFFLGEIKNEIYYIKNIIQNKCKKKSC